MRGERRASPGRARSVGGAALVLALVTGLMVVTPASPADAAADDITITGRGYGHGRGMSQYGALGYAVDHGWDAGRILQHYYSNAALVADAGNPALDVELTSRTGKDTAVAGDRLTVAGQALPAGTSSVRLIWTGGAFEAQVNKVRCAEGGGTWTPWRTFPSGAVVDDLSTATVELCDSSGVRAYRGTLVATRTGSTSYTFNRTTVDDYLSGVVPRESPASWVDAGGGRGLEAIEAQSVAARSYALSSSRASGARTCDTTACQVYGGYASRAYGSSSWTLLEDARTDRAVAGTAGHVLRLNGKIARAEFSSSSGGWTAGGTFPAVEDRGDGTASNPNRSWTVTKSRSAVAASLGTGAIASMTVTARNGLGADGGRATSVRVTTTDGRTSTFTGHQVRVALGLKSDWFTIGMRDQGEVRKVVTALYVDVLGRQPDPTGLATWTSMVMADGDAGQVARGIVMSTERLHTFVTAEYRGALGRDPEPSGRDFWTRYLQSGTTVPELQAFIYSSDEAVARAGKGDVGTWVDAVYRGILGRSAGGSERSFWIGQVGATGRSSVVTAIARSDEAGLRRLDRYYAQMLGRKADPSGIGTFLPLMSGNGDMVLPIHLGSSAEYWARAQSR